MWTRRPSQGPFLAIARAARRPQPRPGAGQGRVSSWRRASGSAPRPRLMHIKPLGDGLAAPPRAAAPAARRAPGRRADRRRTSGPSPAASRSSGPLHLGQASSATEGVVEAHRSTRPLARADHADLAQRLEARDDAQRAVDGVARVVEPTATAMRTTFATARIVRFAAADLLDREPRAGASARRATAPRRGTRARTPRPAAGRRPAARAASSGRARRADRRAQHAERLLERRPRDRGCGAGTRAPSPRRTTPSGNGSASMSPTTLWGSSSSSSRWRTIALGDVDAAPPSPPPPRTSRDAWTPAAAGDVDARGRPGAGATPSTGRPARARGSCRGSTSKRCALGEAAACCRSPCSTPCRCRSTARIVGDAAALATPWPA